MVFSVPGSCRLHLSTQRHIQTPTNRETHYKIITVSHHHTITPLHHYIITPLHHYTIAPSHYGSFSLLTLTTKPSLRLFSPALVVFQTASHVIVTILIKKVTNEDVEVDFGTRHASLTIKLSSGADYKYVNETM